MDCNCRKKHKSYLEYTQMADLRSAYHHCLLLPDRQLCFQKNAGSQYTQELYRLCGSVMNKNLLSEECLEPVYSGTVQIMK